MRIVMLGSAAFSVPTLDALLATSHEVAAVVTQPDRPAGRGHAPTAPRLKTLALAHGLRVLQPENVSAADSVQTLAELAPDALVVAAYGQILRQRVLDVPRRGSLNVHASLLPRHRGAAPVVAAILAGDAVTGVTIMELVRALDAGPVVSSVLEPVLPTDTAGSLEARLATAGAELLVASLDPWAAGEIVATPQDESLASYAPQVKREDALIDWGRPAIEIWRQVRAYNPWPVAHTTFRGEELRIHEAWPLTERAGDEDAAAGTLFAPAPLPAGAGEPGEATFSVQTGEGRLAVRRIQRSGRRVVSGREFYIGLREPSATRFGT
jgi:methionyl-tRNA formyltransferase